MNPSSLLRVIDFALTASTMPRWKTTTCCWWPPSVASPCRARRSRPVLLTVHIGSLTGFLGRTGSGPRRRISAGRRVRIGRGDARADANQCECAQSCGNHRCGLVHDLLLVHSVVGDQAHATSGQVNRTSADTGPDPASLSDPLAPKARPGNPEIDNHRAEQRQADADDVVVVTLDPGHIRATETVDGECTRDVNWLTRGHIGLDLADAEFGEVNSGRRNRAPDQR